MAKVRWFVALGIVGLSLGWGPPTNAEDELERERRSILSLIGPWSGEVVADVGCGKGTWTFPLAKAGVKLVSVCQGVIDWDDFTEWLKYSVDQHGAQPRTVP